MQGFVTIPNIKSDKDIRVLQRLFDEVNTSVRNLNVETSTYGSLLVPLLIEKIPNDLRIRLLEFGIGNLNEMLDFLKLEVEAKENFAAIGTAGTFSNQKYSQSYDKFTTAALNKSTHKNKPYVYCNFTNTLSHMCLKVTNIGLFLLILLEISYYEFSREMKNYFFYKKNVFRKRANSC